jgi:hypothetical protein
VGQSAETKLKLVGAVVEGKRETELQQFIMSKKKPLSSMQCTECLKKTNKLIY